MPRLSCWAIRAALLNLAAGFTLGALLLANKGIAFAPAVWRWLPVHMEFLLIGWLVQLALGVAFWILPRFGQTNPRGNEKPVWVAFVLLNLGIGMVTIGALAGQPWLTLLGRFCETGGVVLFVANAWQRVKPFGA